MKTAQPNNPHKIFASYFKEPSLAPYLFALSKKMEDGNVCLDLNALSNEDEEFWEDFGSDKREVVNPPSSPKLIGASITDKKPFVLHSERLYTGRNFYYETLIIEKLKELSHLDVAEFELRKSKLKDHADFVKSLQSKDKDLASFAADEKPDWQLVAAIQGMLNNITIITGGPGTGKTTTVAKVLALLNKTEENLRVALTAPTGKAAQRMEESLGKTIASPWNKDLGIKELVEGLDSMTIHRLLGASYESVFFKHNENNCLDYDVIIVDESSMIGVALFAKLLNAVKAGTRVILLGDSDQLASVDAGSLFGDLCKSLAFNENKFDTEQRSFLNGFLHKERNLEGQYDLKEQHSFLDQHLVRLKKTYRYDQDSKMGQFTKAVISGEVEALQSILEIKKDNLILDEKYENSLFKDFVNGYTAYIEEDDIEKALDKLNKLRVLCAIREGEQGVYALNREIESHLKSRYKGKEKLFSPSSKGGFYHNQPIMVTKNMTNENLFNGDVGIVRKDKTGNLKAYFLKINTDKESTEKFLEISPVIIPEWETVFAMTIHKSQGSEFENVMVVLPKVESHRLLTRELLYTGITRAEKRVIVQSSMDLIKDTASRSVERVSGIQERIKSENNGD